MFLSVTISSCSASLLSYFCTRFRKNNDQPSYDAQDDHEDHRHYRQAPRVAYFSAGEGRRVVEPGPGVTFPPRSAKSVRTKTFLLTLTRVLIPSSQISGSRSQKILLSHDASSQKKRRARSLSATEALCQGRSETARR
jgi:hypothetical protein